MIRPQILASTLLASLLLVAANPAPARDTRLTSRPYSGEEVVRIEGRSGVQATIMFADDEHIENVAIGDSTSWQVTPNKRANLLFVKPLTPRARTNLTVVSDRRSYFFDLVAMPGGPALYVLRFTYPDEPKAAKPLAAALAMTEDEAEAIASKPVAAPPPAAADPATLNFAWAARGESKLIPARVYDDGAFTFLAWAASSPIPAFLVRNEKGEEGPVNFAVRGDVIVIDGVPELIVLRSGKNAATLENKGPARPAAPLPEPAAIAAAPVTVLPTTSSGEK